MSNIQTFGFRMLGATVTLLLLTLVIKINSQRMEASPFPADRDFSMNINMPDVKPTTVSIFKGNLFED